ncbi:hypothetical protein B0J13DRAFT_557534 [Dactylonectria estremocensis]|uniref:Uncharacterized protein n=1 Tax=Dactylonectria estremocensis TaxID=1079267 RepID=A0A9P9IYC5_9HYPO|nr:hypothetical protein B0J13DRAFT_557534 [Dactylonectria estremocensis]
MWEVSWTDPQAESRKEHREKKTSRREQHPERSRTKASSKLGRRRTSFESKSSGKSSGFDYSETESIDQGLAISATSLRSAKYYSSKAAAILSSDIDVDRCTSMSTCSEVVEIVTPDLSCTPTSTAESAIPQDYFTTSPESSVPRRDRGLQLPPTGAWLDPSMLSPPPSPSSAWHVQSFDPVAYISANYIQTIGSDSFITKRTRVTVSPRTAEDVATKMGSQITITANKFDDAPIQRPSTAGTINGNGFLPESVGPPDGLVPKPAAKSLRRIPSCTSSISTTKWDGWRPPDAWA